MGLKNWNKSEAAVGGADASNARFQADYRDPSTGCFGSRTARQLMRPNDSSSALADIEPSTDGLWGAGRLRIGSSGPNHRQRTVCAVKPSVAFRRYAKQRHASDRIEWLDDGLPRLSVAHIWTNPGFSRTDDLISYRVGVK
jgi:hypothetical protein